MQNALSVSALFQGCAVDAKLFSIRHYKKNRMIDDTPNGEPCVGLIVSGSLDVYSVAADGSDIHLNTLCAGQCFGIYNLLAKAQMRTVLHCVEETVIAYLPKKTLLRLMEENQRLALQYAKLCNEKMQFLLHRIELLTTQSARSRLAHYLLAQRGADGRISLRHTPEILARHLGISRATWFREMAYFQRQGLLRKEKDSLFLPDVLAMEQCLPPGPA